MIRFNKPSLPIVQPSHPAMRGMDALWAFHEGGGSKVHDLIGHNHLTLTTTGGWARNGAGCPAMVGENNVDATKAAASAGSRPCFNVQGNDFTMTVVARRLALPSIVKYWQLMSVGNEYANNSYGFHVYTRNPGTYEHDPEFWIRTTATTSCRWTITPYTDIATIWPVGEWGIFSLVKVGSSAGLYFNGVLKASRIGTMPSPGSQTNALYIGGSAGTSSYIYGWPGDIAFASFHGATALSGNLIRDWHGDLLAAIRSPPLIASAVLPAGSVGRLFKTTELGNQLFNGLIA